MKVAIMIPMDDVSARNAEHLRPDGWPQTRTARTWPVWPEWLHNESTPNVWRRSDVPRWPADVAGDVQRWIGDMLALKRTHMAIVTRCEMVVLRTRRMMIEGAPIEVTIHFPGSDHPTATIGPNGEVDAWPAGLFSEDFEEVKAIRRAH